MITLKTYAPIWTVERRIRKLGTMKLPFDLSFKQLGVGGAAFTLVYLVGKVITYPWPIISYGLLPVALTWFLTKQTMDGKPPLAWMWTVLTWVLRRKLWTCGTWDSREKRWTGGRPLRRGRRDRFHIKVRAAG